MYSLVYVVQAVQTMLYGDNALGVFAVADEVGEKFKGVEFHLEFKITSDELLCKQAFATGCRADFHFLVDEAESAVFVDMVFECLH